LPSTTTTNKLCRLLCFGFGWCVVVCRLVVQVATSSWGSLNVTVITADKLTEVLDGKTGRVKRA